MLYSTLQLYRKLGPGNKEDTVQTLSRVWSRAFVRVVSRRTSFIAKAMTVAASGRARLREWREHAAARATCQLAAAARRSQARRRARPAQDAGVHQCTSAHTRPLPVRLPAPGVHFRSSPLGNRRLGN